jgi:hypothetical protein
MERPDVERHVLEQAFGQHVIRMVVGIDEAWDDELAARFDYLRFVQNRRTPHNLFFQRRILVGRRHRNDARASDEDIAQRRVVDVAVVVVDAPAANEERRVGRCGDSRFNHLGARCGLRALTPARYSIWLKGGERFHASP